MPGSLALFTSYALTRIADLTKKPPSFEYDAINFLQEDWLVDSSKVERELGQSDTPVH